MRLNVCSFHWMEQKKRISSCGEKTDVIRCFASSKNYIKRVTSQSCSPCLRITVLRTCVMSCRYALNMEQICGSVSIIIYPTLTAFQEYYPALPGKGIGGQGDVFFKLPGQRLLLRPNLHIVILVPVFIGHISVPGAFLPDNVHTQVVYRPV